MQNNLNVTLIQTDIHWMDSVATIAYLDRQIQNINTDVIILPEMFATGFCMEPEKIAEHHNGSTLKWMQQKATELDCAICGSLSIKEKDQYVNQFVFVTTKGIEATYNKKHLFTYGEEHKVYQQGNTSTLINYKGFILKPFICYDLRFPVWSRNTENYDIAIYVANWPAKRAFAWNSLLTARAIENMSYVIAVNRIGIDGNNLRYQGDSKVIDPLGNITADCKDEPIMKQVVLKKASVTEARSKFNFLNDRDEFEFI